MQRACLPRLRAVPKISVAACPGAGEGQDANNAGKMVVVLMLLGCQRYAADLVSGVARFRHPLWHVVAVSGGLPEEEGDNGPSAEASPQGEAKAAGSSAEASRETKRLREKWKDISPPNDPRGAISMLRVSSPDTYAGLSEKVFAALGAIRRRFGSSLSGVFKTDDDIVFEPPCSALAMFFARPENQEIGWAGVKTAMARAGKVAESRLGSRGHTGELPPHEKLVYPAVVYCYGAGYWLRADKIDALLKLSPDPPCVLEDVSVGIVMNRLNEVPLRLGDVTYKELPRRA